MEQGRTVRRERVVTTQDQPKEKLRCGRGSSWNEGHLTDLDVEFNPRRVVSFDSILHFPPEEWTPEIRDRMCLAIRADLVIALGKQQLTAIDMDRLQHLDKYKSEINNKASRFRATFTLLLAVMNTTEESEIQSAQSSTLQTSQTSTSQTSSLQTTLATSQKRMITPPTSSSPTKRPKISPKTPDAPTIPADPRHSGGSIESDKVEEVSKRFILAFLDDIGIFLEDHFDTLDWVQSEAKPRIQGSSYSPLSPHF
jgi:hypothetical protein